MHQNSQDVTEEQLRAEIPDLPRGPLDDFRKKASFNWRRMKLVYETLDDIKLKNEIWGFMEKNPLFQRGPVTPTLDEERHLATKRMYALYNEQYMIPEKAAVNPSIVAAESEAIFMYDPSIAVKLSLTFRMCANTIRSIGQPHHYDLIEALEKGKISGCFALTEIGHGSNARGMRTRATFDPAKKQFIMHSDDFEAAKCWVGSLGKCATHAVLYAMLYSKGKNHGLHTFVVPIRDPGTLQPYPGVIVGDLGEKLGLNGIDNGFVMFNNYAIPMEAQLDRLGGVDENGDYNTPFRDPSKRFGASLGPLSGGRVHITTISTNYLQKGIVIAVRYSAVRRQFGPEDGGEELPVLEYQQQQIRLMPYLAAVYAMRTFCNWFSFVFIEMSINSVMGVEDKDAAIRGIEMHALSSAVKPVFGWTTRDGVQNCRECCGGHGYLKAAGIGQLRNDNDANCTYEGENSILLQQASNWLVTLWARRNEAGVARTPYGTLEWLDGVDRRLSSKSAATTLDELVHPDNIMEAYKWLAGYMLKVTFDKVSRLKAQGMDGFQVRNDSQSYTAVTLAVVYGEFCMLNHFYKAAKQFRDQPIQKVLLKMVSLYGSWMLERHLATLYIGGYFSGEQGLVLREGVVRLCRELAPEAVALVDTLAPPDFVLNSVLGTSDGQVYKNLQNNMMTYPGALSRPNWWQDVVHWQTYIQSKL